MLSDRTRSRWGRRRPWLLVRRDPLRRVLLPAVECPAAERRRQVLVLPGRRHPAGHGLHRHQRPVRRADAGADPRLRRAHQPVVLPHVVLDPGRRAGRFLPHHHRRPVPRGPGRLHGQRRRSGRCSSPCPTGSRSPSPARCTTRRNGRKGPGLHRGAEDRLSQSGVCAGDGDLPALLAEHPIRAEQSDLVRALLDGRRVAIRAADPGGPVLVVRLRADLDPGQQAE